MLITEPKEKGLHSLPLDLNDSRALPGLHIHRKICIGDVYASVPLSVSVCLSLCVGREGEIQRNRKLGAEETDYQ